MKQRATTVEDMTALESGKDIKIVHKCDNFGTIDYETHIYINTHQEIICNKCGAHYPLQDALLPMNGPWLSQWFCTTEQDEPLYRISYNKEGGFYFTEEIDPNKPYIKPKGYKSIIDW